MWTADNGVCVKRGVGEMVGVKVTFEFRLSRPKVSTEPTTRMNITPATPPMIHGSQPALFFTVSLKLDGTEIKTTVVLSCPPREFASSTSEREASFKVGFERTISRISSSHTRSVRPSEHKSKTSSGKSCTPWIALVTLITFILIEPLQAKIRFRRFR